MIKFVKNKKDWQVLNLSKGFTLIETLVAISIFSISILSMMSVLSSGISNTDYAKKKMIATYLAQEGIEYIRNMRDTYVLSRTTSQQGWIGFQSKIDLSCKNSNFCYFDDAKFLTSGLISDTDIYNCNILPGGLCINLFYNTTTGQYGYDQINGVDSGFTRSINVTFPLDDNEIKVYSKVSWTQGSGPHSITLTEDLFNWVE